MSRTNEQLPFERGTLKLGVSAHLHQRRRRKRFRVRPEARGVGYENFAGGLSLSSALLSPPVPSPSATADVVVRQATPPPLIDPANTGTEALSGKDCSRRAAQRGVRASLALLACLFAMVCARAHFGSFSALAHWLLAKLPQPVIYERPAREPPSRE